jgi:predicted DNA-binding transcriptional regulator AlpA
MISRGTKPIKHEKFRDKSQRYDLLSRTAIPQPINSTPREIRLLSKGEVVLKVNKTFVTIWRWMQAGKFPRAKDVNGSCMWVEADIDAWISALPTKQFKADRTD